MLDKVNLEQAVSEINENASKNFKEALDIDNLEDLELAKRL